MSVHAEKGSQPLTEGSQRDSALRWGSALDAWDEMEPALALLDAAEVPDVSRHARARLLLGLGQAGAALEVLDRGSNPLPPDGHYSVDDALRAACLAAIGDADAYGWLRARVVDADSSMPWGYLRLLLARAADSVGDTATSDQMWQSVVKDAGMVTWLSLARFTAVRAALARASAAAGQPLIETAAAYRQLVANAELLPNPLDRDARPVVDAVRRLEARGEQRAALFLVTAAHHSAPPNPEVAEAYGRLAPARPGLTGWSRWALVVGCGAAGLAVGQPFAALILAWATLFGWVRLIPIRGWTLVDSRIFRALREGEFDLVTRTAQARGISRRDRPAIVGAGIGGGVGVVAVGPVLASLVPGGIAGSAGGAAWILAAIFGCVAGFLLAPIGARRWRSRRPDLPTSCTCATVSLLSGESADAYASGHLVPGEGMVPVPAGSLLRCPLIDVSWLHVPVTAQGGVYLIRGAAGSAAASPTEPPIGAAGFYL